MTEAEDRRFRKDKRAFLAIAQEQTNFWEIMTFSEDYGLDPRAAITGALETGRLVDDRPELLAAFLNHALPLVADSRSQLMQDLFAAFAVGEGDPKTFLEFGATDGLDLSNSAMLERDLGWTGVLGEPSPRWHPALRANRPDTPLITDCIWRTSGETLDFFLSDIDALSTLGAFTEAEKDSMPANVESRLRSGETIPVRTISLNDVVERYFDGRAPSYMSIDTEGSEFEILRAFDFERYRPLAFTVEHNATPMQGEIDGLMARAGYARVFRELTVFDAWYLREDRLGG